MLYYPLENIKLFWNEIARKNNFIDRLKDLVLGDALRANACPPIEQPLLMLSSPLNVT
jgi:hypothetical protein